MKIITWNVNGIRSLRQDESWAHCKDFAAILQELDGDIICFQETKVSRNKLTADVAIVSGYNSFFSSPKLTQGYSGVATFCKESWTPVDAAEGLSGSLQSQPHPLEVFASDFQAAELKALDSEGRVLITDHRLFVLFNIYFPNDPTDERTAFKLRFYEAVQLRIESLLQLGRSVVLVGDVNACHRPIDHCDPDESIRRNGLPHFQAEQSRQWLDRFLSPKGPMVDLFRALNGDVEKAFTCWNTLTDARVSNFGTRIDYILTSPSLLDSFERCTIESHIMGSDHCPVSAILRGSCIPLQDLEPRPVPSICTRFWKEFSGTQPRLLDFLGPRRPGAEGVSSSTAFAGELGQTAALPSASDQPPGPPDPLTLRRSNSSIRGKPLQRYNSDSSALLKTKRKPALKQQTLSAFIKIGSASRDAGPVPSEAGQNTQQEAARASQEECESAAAASQESTPELPAIEQVSAAREDARHRWKQLLAPKPAPLCYHGEPAKAFVVKKAGTNKGKHFYLCARPVGPSSPTLSSNGITEHRCDFFAWK
ncbi:Endonuclease/exonuclease/phosphatase [Polychytrium aggregatum]|uniref:Endonuclease/exonuclease/phosphatase n=1 Tax=Polychytrium aggregatum TaxID=110093 RepID=UPI0022FF0922|nr:Endonuclease/exonuclease/phosphatase [Polychytrium aggregatum]KAI9205275.1 Endonuclease/exonuclease/phosphatase [Polychytrium aggregatum]